jgi:hypothetical protein
MTFSTDSQRRLIWHGMYLFLLDLLIGFAEGQVINPRMALAAHLEGLMNGTFLIAFGGGVAVCESLPMWIGKKIQTVAGSKQLDAR